MAYHGVKFTTRFIDTRFDTDSRVEELKYWCNTFAKHELAPTHPEGSYGNLSIRIDNNTIMITATSLDLGKPLNDFDFVLVHRCNVDTFEVIASGSKAPSSETPIHMALYEARPDVWAIFHGHNDYLNSHAAELGVAQTPEELPYGSRELAAEAVKLASHDFFNLKNHGFISMGKTMADAGRLALDKIR